eukprot:GHVT01105157.1.p1 GENE.GHVT01105157.1~~GHVT01105157.1.p1  ORF type:complete len:230 (-),score=10.90 GHVT01105157.1:805-1494(-)
MVDYCLTGSGCHSTNESRDAPRDLFLLHRVTCVVSHPDHFALVNQLTTQCPAVDIIAVRPTDERSLQTACQSCECDIISVDLASQAVLGFPFRRAQMTCAVDRGILFEIDLGQVLSSTPVVLPVCSSSTLDPRARDSPLLTGGMKRQNLLMHLPHLLRFLPLKSVIVSSGATNPDGLRAPDELAAFAATLGVGGGKSSLACRQCLRENAHRLFDRAAARKTFGTGCLCA